IWYAIIGMERVGGLFLYDITDPAAPVFLEYVTTRDFSGDAEQGTAGGLGPEGIEIVAAEDSPVGQALAIVSNEVSGSIDIFLLDELSVPVEDPTRPEEAELPMNSRLVSVYPNPFNPITNIEFAVPRDLQVQLEVVDVRGRHVETLVAEAVIAGQHSVTWTAENQPSGVYFARLVTEDRVQVRRLTLVK
ncbi:MAG TPA: T9SS type A sorting domain-containing protein, partial [Myxococcales bacterium LLY-WYZ-16_1]|nr:T9SS type A sorting domain-containing protein [Myxococcales bacterium LLY-WYZ-16_1]